MVSHAADSSERLPEAELDALMARLAAGDRSAFDPLFRALAPRAERFARARVGAADAPDVAQAALLKVFARASEFTPGRACLPWFYAVVANELRAVRRVTTRAAPSADPHALATSLPTAAPDLEREIVERDLARALDRAIAELDTTSAAAIAELLADSRAPDVAPATWRKRLSRACARLRVLIGVDHAF